MESDIFEKAVNDTFLGRTDIEELMAQLERKKALVLQGPPGTGETFIAQQLASVLAKERSIERIEAVGVMFTDGIQADETETRAAV